MLPLSLSCQKESTRDLMLGICLGIFMRYVSRWSYIGISNLQTFSSMKTSPLTCRTVVFCHLPFSVRNVRYIVVLLALDMSSHFVPVPPMNHTTIHKHKFLYITDIDQQFNFSYCFTEKGRLAYTLHDSNDFDQNRHSDT